MIKISYIQHSGSDLMTVNSARISLGDESQELTDKDKKLIDYLAANKHMSPFEHNSLTCLIECPLYIRSQIHRHRTFSYNEVSRRYTSENLEFFIPKTIRKQSKSNRQASDGYLDVDGSVVAINVMKNTHTVTLQAYNDLLKLGIPREQARGVLSQNLMTKFYMTGNLRNWTHFIQLRDNAHAQEEVQIIAKEVKKILEEKFPESAAALFRYI